MALVTPVGTHAQFRVFVHGEGANLNFQHLVLGPDQGGMQRLIAVLLGVGDVIVELVGHVMPAGMHDPQRCVAVGNVRHQNTHGAHIVDLGKIDALALHLAPDRVDMLDPAVHLVAGNALLIEQAFKRRDRLFDVTLSIQSLLRQQLGDVLVVLFVQIAKRQILQLPLELTNTQAMSQRRIDIGDFVGHLQALFPGRLAHLSQCTGALRDLDQGDAHVVDHGDQHLAQVFLLIVLGQPLAGHLLLTDSRHGEHAVDQAGHFLTKAFLDTLDADPALPHGAIEHCRLKSFLIELEFAQDIRHLKAGAET